MQTLPSRFSVPPNRCQVSTSLKTDSRGHSAWFSSPGNAPEPHCDWLRWSGRKRSQCLYPAGWKASCSTWRLHLPLTHSGAVVTSSWEPPQIIWNVRMFCGYKYVLVSCNSYLLMTYMLQSKIDLREPESYQGKHCGLHHEPPPTIHRIGT